MKTLLAIAAILIATPVSAATYCYDTTGDGIADTCSTTRRTLFRGTVTRTRPLATRTRYVVPTATSYAYRTYSSHGGYAVTNSCIQSSRTVYTQPRTYSQNYCPCCGQPTNQAQQTEEQLPQAPPSTTSQTGTMPQVAWVSSREMPVTAWRERSSWNRPKVLLATKD